MSRIHTRRKGPPETLGQRIAERRVQLGLTQEALASAVGVGRSQMTNLEGDRSTMTVSALTAICKLLRISADALLGLEPFPEDKRASAQLLMANEQLRDRLRQVVELASGLADGDG